MADNAGLSAALDGIPMVADAAARDARFPLATRKQNQRVFRLDTGVQQRWSGSAWVDDTPRTFDVRRYGAVGDGVTDDTAAFLAAASSLAPGGRFVIPPGKYKLTDEIALPAGTIVEGASSVDWLYGATPNASSVPSYVWQATANKACFTIGGGASNVRLKDISLGNALSPTIGVATADGKTGIKVLGNYPDYVWNLSVERVNFYGLHYGISVVDPLSGTVSGPHPADWSVAPLRIVDCRFIYPLIGVYLDTTNCDDWSIEGSPFFVPAGGHGVYLQRFGFGRIVGSFAGGSAVSANRFVTIVGNGADSIDNLILEQCQAETLAYFVRLESTGGYGTTPFVLTVRNCMTELSADVSLGNQCRFISDDNRWGSSLHIANASVSVSSRLDRFQESGSYGFVFDAGDPSTVFKNLLPSLSPPADVPAVGFLGTDQYVNGRLERRATAAPASGTYKVGDLVWKADVTTGTPLGYVCVVAGTPGTWVSFGPANHIRAAALVDVSTSNATDLASAIALANALKTAFNTLLANRRSAGEQA